MALTKESYKKRLIDDKIDDCLEVFEAIFIQGPEWGGKIWTALNHANSETYLTIPY